jgi:hypothetical protein
MGRLRQKVQDTIGEISKRWKDTRHAMQHPGKPRKEKKEKLLLPHPRERKRLHDKMKKGEQILRTPKIN